LDASDSLLPGAEELWVGMATDPEGKLAVYQSAFQDGHYTLDQKLDLSKFNLNQGFFQVEAGAEPWRIEWFGNRVGCRPPSRDIGSLYYASITVHPPDNSPSLERRNGIVVGAAKIFDVRALQKMLNDTANQLRLLTETDAPISPHPEISLSTIARTQTARAVNVDPCRRETTIRRPRRLLISADQSFLGNRGTTNHDRLRLGRVRLILCGDADCGERSRDHRGFNRHPTADAFLLAFGGG